MLRMRKKKRISSQLHDLRPRWPSDRWPSRERILRRSGNRAPLRPEARFCCEQGAGGSAIREDWRIGGQI